MVISFHRPDSFTRIGYAYFPHFWGASKNTEKEVKWQAGDAQSATKAAGRAAQES